MAKANQVPDAAVDDPTVDAPTEEKKEDAADEPVVKSGFTKIKVKDFRGSYFTAKFDDNGVAEVDEATLTQLKAQFPGVEITELD